MRFVYEPDIRAITMRETGDPTIEGDTVAFIPMGYEHFGHAIAERLSAPTMVFDPDFCEVV